MVTGTGGVAPPPVGYVPPDLPDVAAGSFNGIFRGRQVVVSGGTNGSGLFVYNGAARAGNPPIFSVVAPGTTLDPFGNTVGAVLEAGVIAGGPLTQVDAAGNINLINSTGAVVASLNPTLQAFLIYSPSAGAGNLVAALAAIAGSDSLGNAYPQGLY